MQQYLDENDCDAHQGVPTSILSYEEHEKVFRHVFTSNLTCWPDFLLSWNGCTATYLRNDSMRKLNFEDIRWDASHGPIFDGNQPGDHCLISFILQPYTHKDDEDRRNQHNNNHSEAPRRTKKRLKKRVVGAYRHVNFLCCTTGCLAMNLFMHQFTDQKLHNMTFFYDDEGKPPTWRKASHLKTVED